MTMQAIYFAFPQAIYLLLLVIPLIFLQLALLSYRLKKTSAYASPLVLPRLLHPRSLLLSAIKMMAYSLSWILICLALMDPQGNLRYLSSAKQPQTVSANSLPRYRPHEVIFLVDTSVSMSVPDGPQKQTRLEQAKDIIGDVISQLKGPTLSLYAFTSTLTPLVPSTHDYLFTRLMVKGLTINSGDVGGTLLGKVLAQLKEKTFPLPTSKLYTLILLSDGGDNEIEKLRGEERQKAIQIILDSIPNPQELHLRFFTIGVGASKPSVVPNVTSEGKPVYSQLEPALLEQLAKHKRGIYYDAQTWTAWKLARNIIQHIQHEPLEQQIEPAHSFERKVSIAKKEEVLSDLYYQFPLGLALILMWMNLILPHVRRL